ncbi:HNH endonuclease [Achromobacter spanius]|jgi:5-methylcytosine-specific restriction protein A|uniref:HNH endonuclease n=1 Tax=Achromobacter spanius TaxID=217203 RepID=UPI00244A86DB|nr:HNH endonuclease [Achromobacter spanius]
MATGFEWVPFFEELADKLLAYRHKQRELVQILESAGVNGLVDQDSLGHDVPLGEIDPFTFLALLNKQSFVARTRALAVVQERLGIRAALPTQFLGVPKADPRQTWLFPYLYDRANDDIDKLWDLFEEVQSGNRITEPVFAKARGVKYAGRAKLTQAIFRVAPRKFFPVDGQTTGYLAGLQLPHAFESAREFQEICALVKKAVPKPLYEQSHDAWYANRKAPPSPESEYQSKVMEKAAKSQRFVEPKGGVPVPKIGRSGISESGYKRKPAVAAEALRLAKFKCEIDPSHQTFTSHSTGKSYVEAHHLIPFSLQGSYPVSLDVTANIIALCPNCHKRLHLGSPVTKKEDILALLSDRKDRLSEKKLKIGQSELLKFYKGDLLEEDA